MSDNRSDKSDQIWQRVRRVILDVVHAVLGPPPPDVAEKIEDVLRDAKRDWDQEKDRCQDEPDETP